jgi:hypothetical protein
VAQEGDAISGDALLVDPATQTVFVQRLFTSYLPPVWGWFTLVWMRKREYL